jgi:hypothetical protein
MTWNQVHREMRKIPMIPKMKQNPRNFAPILGILLSPSKRVPSFRESGRNQVISENVKRD